MDSMAVGGFVVYEPTNGKRRGARIVEADPDGLNVERRNGKTFRILGSVVDGEVEQGHLIRDYPLAIQDSPDNSPLHFYTYQHPSRPRVQ